MLECSKCKAEWPDELQESWGATQETTGYGPQLVCVAIVPARNGDDQVCRGLLRAAADPQDKDRLMKLSPIGDRQAARAAEQFNRGRVAAIRQERGQ